MSLDSKSSAKPGLFITGTDTGVGKTLVAGAIAGILSEQHLKVGVFKPVATGCRHSREGLVSSDAEFLAFCANCEYPLSVVSPACFVTPAAPLVSANCQGQTVDLEHIASAYEYICSSSDVVIVEGIGGVRVPVTADTDVLDLAVQFHLAVVIVCRATLGTINHTLLTIDAIRSADLKLAGVVINGYNEAAADTAERTCAEVIAGCGNVNILAVVPFDETADVETGNLGEVITDCLAQCDWAKLARL